MHWCYGPGSWGSPRARGGADPQCPPGCTAAHPARLPCAPPRALPERRAQPAPFPTCKKPAGFSATPGHTFPCPQAAATAWTAFPGRHSCAEHACSHSDIWDAEFPGQSKARSLPRRSADTASLKETLLVLRGWQLRANLSPLPSLFPTASCKSCTISDYRNFIPIEYFSTVRRASIVFRFSFFSFHFRQC